MKYVHLFIYFLTGTKWEDDSYVCHVKKRKAQA